MNEDLLTMIRAERDERLRQSHPNFTGALALMRRKPKNEQPDYAELQAYWRQVRAQRYQAN